MTRVWPPTTSRLATRTSNPSGIFQCRRHVVLIRDQCERLDPVLHRCRMARMVSNTSPHAHPLPELGVTEGHSPLPEPLETLGFGDSGTRQVTGFGQLQRAAIAALGYRSGGDAMSGLAG